MEQAKERTANDMHFNVYMDGILWRFGGDWGDEGVWRIYQVLYFSFFIFDISVTF